MEGPGGARIGGAGPGGARLGRAGHGEARQGLLINSWR